jgi:hypothetical protein
MLRSMRDLANYAIRATDGTIGHVKDFYFEDGTWVVRYLVIDAGSWLSSRKVLISPMALGQPDWTQKVLPASITKRQVRNSPNIDTDKPVSRQHEKQYLEYYGYPFYWGGAGLWGAGVYPSAMLSIGSGSGSGSGGVGTEYALRQCDAIRAESERYSREEGNPHLRSCQGGRRDGAAVKNWEQAESDIRQNMK